MEGAILELEYVAATFPDQIDTRRVTLDILRVEDRDEVRSALSILVDRLSAASDRANGHKVLHFRAVPEVFERVNEAREVARRVGEALGTKVDWVAADEIRWSAAARQPRQWRNGFTDGATIAWEKSKPVVAPIAIGAATTIVVVAFKGSADASGSTET